MHLLAADHERTDLAGAYLSPLVTCAFPTQRKVPVENNSRTRAGIAGTGVSPAGALLGGVDSSRHKCPASVVATRLPVRGAAVL